MKVLYFTSIYFIWHAVSEASFSLSASRAQNLPVLSQVWSTLKHEQDGTGCFSHQCSGIMSCVPL